MDTPDKASYRPLMERVKVRVCKQGIKHFFTIVLQEKDFSMPLSKCVEISVDDFYKILLGHEAIQANRKGKPGAAVPDNVDILKAKYQDNIKNLKGRKANYTLPDGKKVTIEDKKILVENLLIYCSLTDKLDPPPNINLINNSVYGTEISFNNCIFIYSKSESNIYTNTTIYWHFIKTERSLIEFNNCIFRGISPLINQKSTTHHLKNVTSTSFKNVTAIEPYDGWALETHIDDRLKVTDSDKTDTATANFSIESCYFNSVQAGGLTFTFKGKNNIGNLIFWHPTEKFVDKDGSCEKVQLDHLASKLTYEVYWGPYQKIIPQGRKWQEHKKFLLELKKVAEERQDSSQVNILAREIMICDHELIRQEPWLSSWQDRITLWFNKCVTNYGISWIGPLVLLIGINMDFTVVALRLCYVDIFSWEGVRIFAETFNPLSSMQNVLLLQDDVQLLDGGLALISVLDVLQKVILAICVYEVIRAGRRFSRYSSS